MPCHTDEHIMYVWSTERGVDGMTIWRKCLDCPKVETEWRKREVTDEAH